MPECKGKSLCNATNFTKHMKQHLQVSVLDSLRIRFIRLRTCSVLLTHIMLHLLLHTPAYFCCHLLVSSLLLAKSTTPYVCVIDGCNSSFIRLQGLEEHHRTDHPGVEIPCGFSAPICEKMSSKSVVYSFNFANMI